MQDLSETFPSATFPQRFCVDCIWRVVTVMLNQMRLVCYDRNALLNSLEMCVLNTQICVAGEIACWSEWVSWFSLGSVNKTAILLALKVFFLSFPTSSHSLPVTDSTTFSHFLLVSPFSLMISRPGSICDVSHSGSFRNASVLRDASILCDASVSRSDFGFATPSHSPPNSPEKVRKR